MTIEQAINQAKEQKPNPFSDGIMIGWLSEVDGQVNDFLKHFENAPEGFIGYDEHTGRSQMLLADAPYDGMYIKYLAAQIDLAMEEYERYNISASVFNGGMETYMRHIARTRMPVQNASMTFPRL